MIIDKYRERNKGKQTLNIKPNYDTLQTEIKATEKIYFDENHTVGTLLGFRKRQLEANIKHNSDQPINITKINTLSLNCNIVSGSYVNNTSSHVIHQFAPSVSPGYKTNETPDNVIYLPVNTTTIHTPILKITDQDDTLINFRGEKITIRLHLKPLALTKQNMIIFNKKPSHNNLYTFNSRMLSTADEQIEISPCEKKRKQFKRKQHKKVPTKTPTSNNKEILQQLGCQLRRKKKENMLNVLSKPEFDTSIINKEYYSYLPYLQFFNNNDEIRIAIQN